MLINISKQNLRWFCENLSQRLKNAVSVSLKVDECQVLSLVKLKLSYMTTFVYTGLINVWFLTPNSNFAIKHRKKHIYWVFLGVVETEWCGGGVSSVSYQSLLQNHLLIAHIHDTKKIPYLSLVQLKIIILRNKYQCSCPQLFILCNLNNEHFHMTPCLPCWCPKTVLQELHSFLMKPLSFVVINLHGCWPSEWKYSFFLFFRPFRLSPAPFICPWVSEDGLSSEVQHFALFNFFHLWKDMYCFHISGVV